jgi:dTDP-4-dehydrorhamnose reductase
VTLTQVCELCRQLAALTHENPGQDEEGLDSKDYRALRKLIRSTGKNVVVHALAFTSFHDFEFLNTIRRDLGTVEGGFQVRL